MTPDEIEMHNSLPTSEDAQRPSEQSERLNQLVSQLYELWQQMAYRAKQWQEQEDRALEEADYLEAHNCRIKCQQCQYLAMRLRRIREADAAFD